MSKTLTDLTYDLSVDGLFFLSHLTGFTYREINVIVFCMIIPFVYAVMLLIILRQQNKIKRLTIIKAYEKSKQDS